MNLYVRLDAASQCLEGIYSNRRITQVPDPARPVCFLQLHDELAVTYAWLFSLPRFWPAFLARHSSFLSSRFGWVIAILVIKASWGETLDLFFCHLSLDNPIGESTTNYVVGFVCVWFFYYFILQIPSMSALSQDVNCVFLFINPGLKESPNLGQMVGKIYINSTFIHHLQHTHTPPTGSYPRPSPYVMLTKSLLF